MDKNNLKNVRLILSDFLGIEPNDIDDDDDIVEDLHMQLSDFSDFLEKLKTIGFEVSRLRADKSYTVKELEESLLDE